jgi:hypothetical protein
MGENLVQGVEEVALDGALTFGTPLNERDEIVHIYVVGIHRFLLHDVGGRRSGTLVQADTVAWGIGETGKGWVPSLPSLTGGLVYNNDTASPTIQAIWPAKCWLALSAANIAAVTTTEKGSNVATITTKKHRNVAVTTTKSVATWLLSPSQCVSEPLESCWLD